MIVVFNILDIKVCDATLRRQNKRFLPSCLLPVWGLLRQRCSEWRKRKMCFQRACGWGWSGLQQAEVLTCQWHPVTRWFLLVSLLWVDQSERNCHQTQSEAFSYCGRYWNWKWPNKSDNNNQSFTLKLIELIDLGSILSRCTGRCAALFWHFILRPTEIIPSPVLVWFLSDSPHDAVVGGRGCNSANPAHCNLGAKNDVLCFLSPTCSEQVNCKGHTAHLCSVISLSLELLKADAHKPL